MTRTRVVLFGATLAFYTAIIVAVLTTSWLVDLDWKVFMFRPFQQWPELHAFLDYFVVLGQRGPTAVMVAAWLGWRSWRQHTLRPLITLGAALLLLNVTVGAVKIGLGRLGPHYATTIGSAELYQGGDIFPSGHTANAVVTWGILAYLASTPLTRRYLSVVSSVIALGVGATTVYLGTHWLSDVLLGWAAGLLILLALPWFEPLIGRAEALIFAVRERWRTRRRLAPVLPSPFPPAPRCTRRTVRHTTRTSCASPWGLSRDGRRRRSGPRCSGRTGPAPNVRRSLRRAAAGDRRTRTARRAIRRRVRSTRALHERYGEGPGPCGRGLRHAVSRASSG